MRTRGLTPSTKVVNRLLGIYLQNDNHEEALALFDQMKKSRLDALHAPTLPSPDAHTYHIMIAASFTIPSGVLQPYLNLSDGRKISRSDWAERLFTEMKLAGILPNPRTWLFIMQLQQHQRMYQKMINTWKDLLKTIDHSKLEAQHHDVNLKRCFDLVLYALLRMGYWWDAALLFRQIAKIKAPARCCDEKQSYPELLSTLPNCFVNSSSLYVLVRGFAFNAKHLRLHSECGRSEACLDAMTAIVAEFLSTEDLMSIEGTLPVVISALCKSPAVGRAREALDWFEKLKATASRNTATALEKNSINFELQFLLIIALSRHADSTLLERAWNLYKGLPATTFISTTDVTPSDTMLHHRFVESTSALLAGLIGAEKLDYILSLISGLPDCTLSRIFMSSDPPGTIMPLLRNLCREDGCKIIPTPTHTTALSSVKVAERVLLLCTKDLRWDTGMLLEATTLIARTYARSSGVDLENSDCSINSGSFAPHANAFIERLASSTLFSGPAGPQLQLILMQAACEASVSVIATSSSGESPALRIAAFLECAYQTPQLNASLTPILSVETLFAVTKQLLASPMYGRKEVVKLRDAMERLEKRLGRKGVLAQALTSVLEGDLEPNTHVSSPILC
jgi:pentatricopeptide repeat protein